MRNGSGYSDPTAAAAVLAHVSDEKERFPFEDPDERNNKLMKSLKQLIDLAGFDLMGRITVRDRKSGKVYR